MAHKSKLFEGAADAAPIRHSVDMSVPGEFRCTGCGVVSNTLTARPDGSFEVKGCTCGSEGKNPGE